MELDFRTVKALSSPTRIRILNKVLEGESTPTSLSNDLEKSKSTVSSHLETLIEAELVEKDAEEGRRRVVYQPTRKAQHIVEGREQTVKFSLTSSIVSGIAGFALVGSQVLDSGTYFGMKAAEKTTELQAESGPGVMTADGMNAARNGAEAASQQAFEPATAFLAAGVGLLGLSAATFFYGLAIRKIGQ